MRVLVLIADGAVSANSDSISDVVLPAKAVPVTRSFDRDQLPIGSAVLSLEGNRVMAEIQTEELISGLFPCVGGKVGQMVVREDGIRELRRFEILEISLCEINADPRIPAI